MPSANLSIFTDLHMASSLSCALTPFLHSSVFYMVTWNLFLNLDQELHVLTDFHFWRGADSIFLTLDSSKYSRPFLEGSVYCFPKILGPFDTADNLTPRTIWHFGQFDTIMAIRTIWHHEGKEDNLTPRTIWHLGQFDTIMQNRTIWHHHAK